MDAVLSGLRACGERRSWTTDSKRGCRGGDLHAADIAGIFDGSMLTVDERTRRWRNLGAAVSSFRASSASGPDNPGSARTDDETLPDRLRSTREISDLRVLLEVHRGTLTPSPLMTNWQTGNRSVPGASGEGGEWIAAAVGDEQFAEIGEQRAVLLAAGGGGRQRAFGESLAVVALGAEGDFAVDDR